MSVVYTLQTVDSFTCIALAGVSTEYLKFDLAEGGLNDINQVSAQRPPFGSHSHTKVRLPEPRFLTRIWGSQVEGREDEM
jgi:hypothetical protein